MHPGRSQEGCATIPRVARPRKDPVYAKNRALMRFGAKAIGVNRHYGAARAQLVGLSSHAQYGAQSRNSAHNRGNAGLCVGPLVAEPVKRAYGEPIAIGYGRKAQ